MYKATTQRRQEDRPPPPGPKNFVEWYLLSYNQVSTMGWLWILFLTVSEIYNNDGDYKDVFDIVWPALSYVQTAALFEVNYIKQSQTQIHVYLILYRFFILY